MKEKVKSAPKQLVRRGLDDGTERLRDQLRDTAQRGQADDYGGDRIEDTAVGGARRAERGIENLLKKKRAGKRDTPQDRTPSQEPSAPEPGPEGSPFPPQTAPAPTTPRAADQPRIKTREAVAAREGSTSPSGGGRTESIPVAGSERQKIKMRESTVRGDHKNTPPVSRDGTEPPQIRTRESAVYDPPASEEPVVRTGSERPQIRTRENTARGVRADAQVDPRGRPEPLQIKTKEAVTGAPSDHRAVTAPSSGENPPERLSIKTKDACIQKQPASALDQPSQALVQGKQEFMQERGRTAAIKQAEAQRIDNGTVPQVKGSGDTAPSAPARRGYAGGQGKYAPAQAVQKPASPGEPDTRPVRDGGRKIIKTVRSGRKTAERTANGPLRLRNALQERPSRPPSGRRKQHSRRSRPLRNPPRPP